MGNFAKEIENMALPINIEDLLNKRKIEGNRIEFKKGKAVRSRATAETSGGACLESARHGEAMGRAPGTHWILPELGHCPRIPAL